MAAFTGIGTGNVGVALASRNDAVVATKAGAQNFVMVDFSSRFPQGR